MKEFFDHTCVSKVLFWKTHWKCWNYSEWCDTWLSPRYFSVYFSIETRIARKIGSELKSCIAASVHETCISHASSTCCVAALIYLNGNQKNKQWCYKLHAGYVFQHKWDEITASWYLTAFYIQLTSATLTRVWIALRIHPCMHVSTMRSQSVSQEASIPFSSAKYSTDEMLCFCLWSSTVLHTVLKVPLTYNKGGGSNTAITPQDLATFTF